jgi:hypothetical protein
MNKKEMIKFLIIHNFYFEINGSVTFFKPQEESKIIMLEKQNIVFDETKRFKINMEDENSFEKLNLLVKFLVDFEVDGDLIISEVNQLNIVKISETVSYYYSILLLACKGFQLDLIEYLLENKADVKNTDHLGRNVFHLLALGLSMNYILNDKDKISRVENVIQKLKESGLSLDEKTNPFINDEGINTGSETAFQIGSALGLSVKLLNLFI